MQKEKKKKKKALRYFYFYLNETGEKNQLSILIIKFSSYFRSEWGIFMLL